MNERFARLFRSRNAYDTRPQPSSDDIARLVDTVMFFARTLDVYVSELPHLADIAYEQLDYDVAEPNTRTVYYLLRVIFVSFNFHNVAFDAFVALLIDRIDH